MKVEAGFLRSLLVVLAPPARDRNENSPGERWVAANLPRDVVSAHAGKPDIEKDDLGKERPSLDQGFRTIVGGLGLVSQEIKHGRKHLCPVDVVVDYEDAKTPRNVGLHGPIAATTRPLR